MSHGTVVLNGIFEICEGVKERIVGILNHGRIHINYMAMVYECSDMGARNALIKILSNKKMKIGNAERRGIL